ncbi:MAG TPA: ATP-dependent Clp protease adapter ClpS [Arcobacter sp.]|nr:ATP-dependent Clp protease adapter ClpS [Arcobacter sp.]HIP56237.1 ATP-dependent Clp protease adapter ClpS [Arcobacter sp.]
MATHIEHELDEEIELQEPKKYKVLLLNDDYSTMEFVVEVLIRIFRKSQNEAAQITMQIHEQGKAVCGIYTHEIASTKVAQVKANARKAQYPLKAIMEEE